LDLDAVWGSEWGRLRMGVLDGVVIVEGKGAVLGVNVGRPIVAMGTSLHSCAEVRELIKLFFGMVSRVGLGIRVLDGRQRVPRERGLGLFGPIGLNGAFLTEMYLTRI